MVAYLVRHSLLGFWVWVTEYFCFYFGGFIVLDGAKYFLSTFLLWTRVSIIVISSLHYIRDCFVLSALGFAALCCQRWALCSLRVALCCQHLALCSQHLTEQSALGFVQSALGFVLSALGFVLSALGFVQSALGFVQSALGFVSSARPPVPERFSTNC